MFAVLEDAQVEAFELVALDRGLEGEIEVGQGLHRRQPCRAHGSLQAAPIAERDLAAQERRQRLAGGQVKMCRKRAMGVL